MTAWKGCVRWWPLAQELGEAFKVRGIRLDSGDLAEPVFESRRILDEAGLEDVGVFASGSLNEDAVAPIVSNTSRQGAR
jgi:nicotinate phosphoribosyltransferase